MPRGNQDPIKTAVHKLDIETHLPKASRKPFYTSQELANLLCTDIKSLAPALHELGWISTRRRLSTPPYRQIKIWIAPGHEKDVLRPVGCPGIDWEWLFPSQPDSMPQPLRNP